MLRATVSEEPLYARGKTSEKRICPLHPNDIVRLDVHDDAIVELLGRSAATLRAWVVASDGVGEGTVPLDRIACSVLQEEAGGRVQVRPLRVDVPA